MSNLAVFLPKLVGSEMSRKLKGKPSGAIFSQSHVAKGELLIVLPFLTLPVYIAQSRALGSAPRRGMLLKKEECVSCRDIEEKREQV